MKLTESKLKQMIRETLEELTLEANDAGELQQMMKQAAPQIYTDLSKVLAKHGFNIGNASRLGKAMIDSGALSKLRR